MKYLLITLIILSGCHAKQTTKRLQKDFKKLKISWKKPYTKEIKHYPIVMRYWSTENDNITHFPKKLNKAYKGYHYELFFTPRILQSGSSLVLKITFPSEQLAEQYFFKKTNAVFKKEYNSFTDFQEDYCNKIGIEDSFKTAYNISSESRVRLMNSIPCSGKEVPKGRTIKSGVLLDDQNKSVVCWTLLSY